MDYLQIFISIMVLVIAFIALFAIKLRKFPKPIQEMTEKIHSTFAIAKDFLSQSLITYSILIIGIFIAGGIVFRWDVALVFVLGSMVVGLVAMLAFMQVKFGASRIIISSQEGGLENTMLFTNSVVNSFALLVSGLATTILAIVTINFHQHELLVAYALSMAVTSYWLRLSGGLFLKSTELASVTWEANKDKHGHDFSKTSGDICGGVVAMISDVVTSQTIAAVAAILLGTLYFTDDMKAVWYVLTLMALGLLATVFSLFITKSAGGYILRKLYEISLVIVGVVGVIGSYFISGDISRDITRFTHNELWYPGIVGIVVGAVAAKILQYSIIKKNSILSDLDKDDNNPTTVIFSGILRSVAVIIIPLTMVVCGVVYSFSLSGAFGVAVMLMHLLIYFPLIVGFAGYGPTIDVVSGLAKNMGDKISLANIKRLESDGGIAKTISKSITLFLAGISGLVFVVSYIQILLEEPYNVILSLQVDNYFVLAGLFSGISLPFVFSGIVIYVLLKISNKVRNSVCDFDVNEKRSHLRKCYDIASNETFFRVWLPFIFPILLVFLTVGFGAIIHSLLGTSTGVVKMLGGFMTGATISGLVFGLICVTAGGIWNNLKRNIDKVPEEMQKNGLKESARIGDEIGQVFSGLIGPSLGNLIKVIALTTVLLAGLAV